MRLRLTHEAEGSILSHAPPGTELAGPLDADLRIRELEAPDIDPNEFDIARPPRPSLGFGGGPHVCLGMHVARAQMQIGIGALLDRFTPAECTNYLVNAGYASA